MRAMATRLSRQPFIDRNVTKSILRSPTHVLQLEWPNVTKYSPQRPDKGFRTVYGGRSRASGV
eukprot:7090677-Prymnesium_polylepis.1